MQTLTLLESVAVVLLQTVLFLLKVTKSFCDQVISSWEYVFNSFKLQILSFFCISRIIDLILKITQLRLRKQFHNALFQHN